MLESRRPTSAEFVYPYRQVGTAGEALVTELVVEAALESV
jgi:hypothetical protein